MKSSMANNRDFWAGVFLIAIGAAAMLMARDYAFGTALRMGPGYFPNVLGGMLILFGIYLVAAGLHRGEPIAGPWSLRALVVVPASLALFGALVDRAGFIPAMLVHALVDVTSGVLGFSVYCEQQRPAPPVTAVMQLN